MSSAPGDNIGIFTTPRRFKCSQFHKGTLDLNFECIKLLQNDFCKQRHIPLNVTIPGQDRICPKTHLCRTFFAEYMSCVMSKPDFCTYENKDIDQLCGDRTADQRLCFRYMDSTIPLLLKLKFQASSHLLLLYSPVCVGPGRKP